MQLKFTVAGAMLWQLAVCWVQILRYARILDKYAKICNTKEKKFRLLKTENQTGSLRNPEQNGWSSCPLPW